MSLQGTTIRKKRTSCRDEQVVTWLSLGLGSAWNGNSLRTWYRNVKFSTLLLYSRVFPGRLFWIKLWSVGVFIAACTGVQVLTAISQYRSLKGP